MELLLKVAAILGIILLGCIVLYVIIALGIIIFSAVHMAITGVKLKREFKDLYGDDD